MKKNQVIWLTLQEGSKSKTYFRKLLKNHQKTKTNVGICEAVWWTGWNSSLIPLSNLQLFQQMASHYFQAVYFCPISFDICTYISYFFGSIFILPCVESWIVWELCSSLFPRHICLSFYLLSYILYFKFLSCLISNCLSKWILITSMPFTFTFFCVEDLDRIAITT